MTVTRDATRLAQGRAVLPAGSDDADVVTRVLGGDREAFATLVRRHQGPLYRYARAMELDHDAASDVVQETFVRAYQNLNGCREPARFRGWLFRIVRNLALDQRRSVHARALPLEEAEIGGAEATAFEPQLRHALNLALDALPEGLREAFLLKHVEGWSYEEMAASMDASVSALKMRVHRARDMLRAALGAFSGESVM